MSGEETNGESTGKEKQLILVPVDWINPALTDVFHVIDDWRKVMQGETFQETRGNREFLRGTKQKHPVASKATRFLPRNWYDDNWYRQLPDGKRTRLEVMAEHEIPSLVSQHHFPCIHLLISLQPAAPTAGKNKSTQMTATYP